jgi:hypothetical protein
MGGVSSLSLILTFSFCIIIKGIIMRFSQIAKKGSEDFDYSFQHIVGIQDVYKVKGRTWGDGILEDRYPLGYMDIDDLRDFNIYLKKKDSV